MIAIGVIIFLSLLLLFYIRRNAMCRRVAFPLMIPHLNKGEQHELTQVLLESKSLSHDLGINAEFPNAVSSNELVTIDLELLRLSVDIPIKLERRNNEAREMNDAIQLFGIFVDKNTT